MYNVLFVTSEAHPLVKTGGLADVSGALPRALRSLGCDVRLMLPAYSAALDNAGRLKTVAQFVPAGGTEKVSILEGDLPGTRVRVWLIDYAPYYDRPGNPYLDEQGVPWPDNAQRYALLARAAVDLALDKAGLGWRADLVHCNDWQSALIPALLNGAPNRPATVFTIHNMAYQGLFPFPTFAELDLPPALWSHEALEFHDQLSFIKGGLVYADRINTVSPRYAEEIQTPEFGYGLDGLLRYRSDVLSGIVNGIDESIWNPARDIHITAHYNRRHLEGKERNKAMLQQEMKLPENPDTLLIGFIGRMVEQKGVDLILDVLPQLLDAPVQFAILGSGEQRFQTPLKLWSEKYPDQLGLRLGYDEGLAHRIEAGCDAFVMPSRFEPCGLNQLYSLRYGTVPIVHSVGGLADTVVDAGEQTLLDGTATGFCFNAATPEALEAAIRRALELFQNQPAWKRLMISGMQQNYTWRDSAQQYLSLYQDAIDGNK